MATSIPPFPPPPGGPPAPGPPGALGQPVLNHRQRQALLEQQRQQGIAQARLAAGAGAFIEADLERLLTIGGSGAMRPRAERNAPLTAVVGGQQHFVVDMPIDQGTPEFWVRYLFDELMNDTSKHALAGFADRGLLLAFYNRVFYRPDDFDQGQGYVVPRDRKVRDCYQAGTTGDDLLRSHLRAALDLGFDWMQWPKEKIGGTPAASTMVAVKHMMEIKAKTLHTPLVWRTEDRRTMRALRKDVGFTQQVTVDTRITALGMDQAWNPYSTEEVRGRLWYRRYNTDNCLYTGISVALHPFASLVFPKITLSPTTLAPVANEVLKAIREGRTPEAVLLEPNGEVKAKFAEHVALLQLPGQKNRLVLYSRARTILMALEGKYLDTQGVQAGGKADRSQSFPEYGSVGISPENVFAQVELHRFFHGWTDDEGFTAFVNPANCDIVGRSAIMQCFPEVKGRTEYAAKVEKTYQDLSTGGPYGLAWAAGGMGHNKIDMQFRNVTAAWVGGRRLSW